MICIKVKKAGEDSYKDSETEKVMPAIREMAVGDHILFPFDFREAVRTACSILRRNEGLNVYCRVVEYEGTKWYRVGKYEHSAEL